MHSNLSDHNNLSKSMNCELSALEILGSKLGLSTDSALDDQEKTGNKKPSALEILGSKLGLSTDSALDDQEKTENKKPEVAIIRVKDSHKARKVRVLEGFCDLRYHCRYSNNTSNSSNTFILSKIYRRKSE